MEALSFTNITDRLRKWNFPDGIDAVIGIATGGVVPAALVAQHLGLELTIIRMSFRDESNEPKFEEPKLLSAVPSVGSWRRVLLVDDVYVSGKSWHAARALLPANLDVLPFVLKGKTDFALFPEIRGCVRWPWKLQ